MNKELIDNLKKMAFQPIVDSPPVFFLTRKGWLKARELGWFTFTDEQLDTANDRMGLICENNGCGLYIHHKFHIKKQT